MIDADHLALALRDRYVLERELGRGGMATVYLAHDVHHDRPVALKVLHPEIAAGLGSERFLREIHLAARLQHPHILTVYDSGEAAGRLWFTMPFIEGESLRDRLRREGQLPVADAVRITREAALALERVGGGESALQLGAQVGQMPNLRWVPKCTRRCSTGPAGAPGEMELAARRRSRRCRAASPAWR